MSSTSRAWMVAASIGVVEALKDQGLCRWNHAFRSLLQHPKFNIRSYYQHPKMLSSSSAAAATVASNKLKDEKLQKSEESLRTVMYLSCWGPN